MTFSVLFGIEGIIAISAQIAIIVNVLMFINLLKFIKKRCNHLNKTFSEKIQPLMVEKLNEDVIIDEIRHYKTIYRKISHLTDIINDICSWFIFFYLIYFFTLAFYGLLNLLYEDLTFQEYLAFLPNLLLHFVIVYKILLTYKWMTLF